MHHVIYDGALLDERQTKKNTKSPKKKIVRSIGGNVMFRVQYPLTRHRFLRNTYFGARLQLFACEANCHVFWAWLQFLRAAGCAVYFGPGSDSYASQCVTYFGPGSKFSCEAGCTTCFGPGSNSYVRQGVPFILGQAQVPTCGTVYHLFWSRLKILV